jgi:osmotically-inducible protein OsmY
MNKTPMQFATVDLSPEEIKGKIRSAFYNHAFVDSEGIVVTAHGRTVLLAGKVRSWTEKKDAEDVAWSMPGVTHVENRIEIQGEVYNGE